MEMEIPFPFCVPVAAGIVSVFMGNPMVQRFASTSWLPKGDPLFPPEREAAHEELTLDPPPFREFQQSPKS